MKLAGILLSIFLMPLYSHAASQPSAVSDVVESLSRLEITGHSIDAATVRTTLSKRLGNLVWTKTPNGLTTSISGWKLEIRELNKDTVSLVQMTANGDCVSPETVTLKMSSHELTPVFGAGPESPDYYTEGKIGVRPVKVGSKRANANCLYNVIIELY